MRVRQITVLHCFASLNKGGIETWLVNLLRQRPASLHFDFLLSTPGGFYEEEVRGYGCRILYHRQTGRLQRRLHMLGLGESPYLLEEVLKANRYDAVHAHGTEFLGDVMKTAAACGVPQRIAHCHTTGIGRFRSSPEMWLRGVRFRTLDRQRILRYATDILACSHESGRFFVSGSWGRDRRCRPLYCGVPLDHFDAALDRDRRGYRASRGIPEDAIVVGHVGSMGPNPVKNHPFLLRVFKELSIRNPRYLLFLAGDGPLRPAIRQQVKELGLEGRVLMPGICDDVPSLMVHGFDVHLLPSLYEGLPIAGLEAAAAGLFTVCSDTITRDFTDSLGARVKPLSLQAPVAQWADQVARGIELRIPPLEGIDIVRQSPFSIGSSLESLMELYGGITARAASRPAAA